ncbi:membrane protein [Actinoplanes sp. SE50]|uniref:DUF1304 domain-containing protein n=1 Tax=unclassified Actinoplanes TaxID=2626549 RepID=UPI00023EC266|nr:MULTISPECIES: DUF1304 domain-containing protein [unclassified Actinoplanes]AEV83568.1 ypaA-like uncharacterized protein [Actinoplanes sp. SE50/110]ATO82288.1 membrane protein [Actinoplanes sp. SE50]SLL99695.1 putative membrane protein [Actinoplanes sp. SE50/110]
MIIVGNVLTGLVALIHMYIVVLETVLWTKPQGRKAFGLTPEFAEQTRVLGLNQGLYNGFLAAGLIAGLIAGGHTGFAAKIFFLVCVAVAGIVGATTASRRILYVQTVPAALALLFVLLGGY